MWGRGGQARRIVLRFGAALGCLTAILGVLPGAALADLWVSAGGTDSGFCSQANPCATISRAVSLALANDTIHVGGGTITDHVTIPPSIPTPAGQQQAVNLVIQGAGMHATTVSGGFNGSGRVFTIPSGATVTINDMTITGGEALDGGGIANAGVLTLERDSVASNLATAPNPAAGGDGGGVYSSAGPGSGLTIQDSEITGNSATDSGGGIWSTSTANIDRDLVYKNLVIDTSGGGADQGGGIWLGPTSGSVTDDTITANQIVGTSTSMVGDGGGVYNRAEIEFQADTIVGNTAATDPQTTLAFLTQTILGDDCPNKAYVADDGYNVFMPQSCADVAVRAPGRSRLGDPLLGPLADNGGPTRTMAIPATSPAYDLAQGAASCSGTDQRGVSRLQRGAQACDAGAYQVEAPTTYVANPSAGSVTAYASGATADAAPVLNLSGSSTGLSQPTGVVTDVNGHVFVANAGNNSITEYAAEVTGNVAPIATISGSRTLLNKPQDLALDGAGRLLVTNLVGSVTEYAPGANGNVAPVARIGGSKTLLNQPHGIVIDPAGRLRVSTANGTVNTYAANATGNVAPLSRLNEGASANPQGLNFDPAGQLVVANAGRGQVNTYAATATGRATPLSVLSGAPALQAPTGLDLDESGDIFIAETTANRVIEFAPGSSGTATPLSSIAGPDTGLSSPAFLSELPPTPAPHVRLSTRRRVTRKQVLAGGIVLRLRAFGSLAFRGEPVLISAVARVRRATIAVAGATPLRPGRAVLRVVQTRRARGALLRGRVSVIVLTIALRDGVGVQTRRITIRCRG